MQLLTGRARAALTVPLALGLALALTGCIKPPLSADTVTGPGGGNSPVPGVSDTAEPNESESDDPGSNATPSACLVGEWLVDNEHMGAFFKRMAAQAGTDGGTVSNPSGDVILNFTADAQYAVTYHEWTMQMTQDGSTITVQRDGTDRGTYTATDDGALTQNDTQMGSTVTITTPMGGFEVDGTPASTSSQYACDNTTLNVTNDGETFIAHRR